MCYFHYFSQTCYFHFDLQKRAQTARTNDRLHPKHEYVTYVTVKELGGNHFAGGCYNVLLDRLRLRRDPALPAPDGPVHFVTNNLCV